jgi:hypothetical protein
MTAQVAGAWFVPLLDLEPILAPDRIEKALDGLYEHNLAPFQGCMCNETGDDPKANRQSWPYYAETFYAAPAIMAGKVSAGMELERRFANAMEKHGRHWDLPLMWGGEQMDEPMWGRWYMTTPASWFVLQALTGVWYDGLTKTLTARPQPWDEIGHLSHVPVFHPLFWGHISTDNNGWTLVITELRQGPIEMKELLVEKSAQLTCNDTVIELSGADGRYALTHTITSTSTSLCGLYSNQFQRTTIFDRK